MGNKSGQNCSVHTLYSYAPHSCHFPQSPNTYISGITTQSSKSSNFFFYRVPFTPMVSTSLLYILLDASFYKNNNATTSWLAICHSVVSVCYPSLHYCHFNASPSSYNLLFTLIFYLWIHLFKECLTSQWHTPENFHTWWHLTIESTFPIIYYLLITYLIICFCHDSFYSTTCLKNAFLCSAFLSLLLCIDRE